MARLLCSYGARPRQYHNFQGQTPLSLAKYVLQNPKMTKLLASFAPTSLSCSNTIPAHCHADEIKSTSEESYLPLDLSSRHETTLRKTAKVSSVDGGCRRLRNTSIGIEIPAATVIPTLNVAKKPPTCETPDGGSISGRPYLHREVKSAFCQGNRLILLIKKQNKNALKYPVFRYSPSYGV